MVKYQGKEYEKQAPPPFRFVNAEGNCAIDEHGRVWDSMAFYPDDTDHSKPNSHEQRVIGWIRRDYPALVEIK